MTIASALSRRDALRIAAGLGVSFALPALDLRAATARGRERPKSLILVWLAGGPSQLETWDPHPGTRIGGLARGVKTSIHDCRVAHFYPQVAEQLAHVNVIRSLVSEEGDHARGSYLLKTGYRPEPTLTHPSIGAVLTHELPDPAVEIPLHVSLGNSQWPGWPGRGGFLGDRYDAFKVYAPGRNVPNLRAPVGDDRQRRRLAHLEAVSRTFTARRPFAADRTLHESTTAAALTMMNSEQVRAFEIDDEPERLRRAYGETDFGRGCLVARRLVETGVRAVEVNLGGFDSHASNHEAHAERATMLDPALATLIADLRQRDLHESTLVLVLGEFGRTPQINALAGRDHWPTGFSCLIGGGGLVSGQVIGATDPDGRQKQPADPVPVADLFATVYHALGVDHEKELITPISRPIAISAGTPLARLLPG